MVFRSLTQRALDPVPAAGDEGGQGPDHVAIIMDGNRRWAKAHGMPPVFGHQRGADAVRASIEGCIEHGIRHLTLFAFSSENWKRPQDEVDELMNLLRFYLRREIGELRKSGVRVQFLGERDLIARDIADMMSEAERRTTANDRLILTIALNYGSRWEIVRAARALAADAAAGRLQPEEIDETLFTDRLNVLGLPDPDLLIRTSGEQRISNFMLWQLAYTELAFLEVHWPEFDKSHFAAAIRDFRGRDRRFGASSG